MIQLSGFYSLQENTATVEKEIFDICFEEIVSLSEKTSSSKVQQDNFKKQISLQEILMTSEPMALLFRKIQAFETLIEKTALLPNAISLDIKSLILLLFSQNYFLNILSNLQYRSTLCPMNGRIEVL